MKDTLHPFLSNYSGARWSALDEATVEGEFPLGPLFLRYVKAKRRLHLRLTKVSALETWGTTAANAAAVCEQSLSAQGELAEVLTTFELNGGPICQFRDVKSIMIAPASVKADDQCCRQDDQVRAQLPGPDGALFVEFEAYKMHGEHTDPVLSLTLTMGPVEFQRIFSLVRGRSEDLKGVTIVLEAELFGDEPEPEDTGNQETIEYGMLRPAVAPLAFVQARLERVAVSLEWSAIFCSGALASVRIGTDQLEKVDLPIDRSAIIARRLGWIIALLVLIALIVLSGEDRSKGVKWYPRMIAANTQSSILAASLEKVAELDT